MIKEMDDDRADWLHEVKRDKRLDRMWELEAENSLLTDALANYEQENARLRKTLNEALYCLNAWERGADAEDYFMDITRVRAALEQP